MTEYRNTWRLDCEDCETTFKVMLTDEEALAYAENRQQFPCTNCGSNHSYFNHDHSYCEGAIVPMCIEEMEADDPLPAEAWTPWVVVSITAEGKQERTEYGAASAEALRTVLEEQGITVISIEPGKG